MWRWTLLLLAAAVLHAETVVFLGDSLTAGHGVAEREAWPALVAERMKGSFPAWQAVNAGISGDTTAGGLRRLPRLLERLKPDLVVVGLGANDGLRGQDPDRIRENLRAIIARCRDRSVRTALLGMQLPPSLGPEHAQRFAALWAGLAKDENVPLLPFLLEGVAGKPELNNPDGIHPNPEGHRIIAETVWKFLEPLLRKG
jgi:acyl-CoA thioesterase-1